MPPTYYSDRAPDSGRPRVQRVSMRKGEEFVETICTCQDDDRARHIAAALSRDAKHSERIRALEAVAKQAMTLCVYLQGVPGDIWTGWFRAKQILEHQINTLPGEEA